MCPLNYLLHVRVMLTIIKLFIILFLLWLWEWIPWQFSKQIGKLSFQLNSQVYILFLVKLTGKERSFLESVRRGATLWDYPQEYLVVIRDEKIFPFVKFEINVALLCFLLDLPTNKHCRTWSSMINLSIDSRACQK